MIFSGEFHYWRLPDRTRWEPTLKQYKAAGLNAIRIYFHWGFHSPAEGVYHFDGNRDIEYLLNLCEKLNLYVMAAPGPYICAETHAGGYPSWLVAKRHLRIRHNMAMLWRTYDEEFAMHELEWYRQILPIIARHQITNKPQGCVIAVQPDNELFEVMHGLLPVGLHDQMRILAKGARDAGITVPLFTNDGFEEGGWIPRTTFARTGMPHRDQSKGFGIDWYGFDKYVVFAPSSSPKSWLIDDGQGAGEWSEWDPRIVKNAVDKLEKTVRGFGGGAAETPLFCPEMQGGWFNHYLLNHTYDEIFDFFGENYTKLILDSLLAQGVTMNSIYIIYGGTNWGMLGDPDVYTSYDYSACIREYGYISSRLRAVRQSILFSRSFGIYLTKTDRVESPTITLSIPDVLNVQRITAPGVSDQQVEFSFLRNFDKKRRDTFQIEVPFTSYMNQTITLALSCQLPYKQTMTTVGNYVAANGARLILSTLPIITRILTADKSTEVWIVAGNSIGEIAFDNSDKDLDFTGNMRHSLRDQGAAIVIGFGDIQGWTKVSKAGKSMYIVSLSPNDVATLYADFHDPFWHKEEAVSQPTIVTWGSDSAYYNHEEGKLEISYNDDELDLHILSFDKTQVALAQDKYNLPFIYHQPLNRAHQDEPTLQIPLTNWEFRTTDLATLPWTDLVPKGKEIASFDSLDHLYTSGHVLYRTTFKADQGKNVTLSLNARNRATVILNGKIIGGHTTYSRQLFMPGAKIGPDPSFLGSQKHTLPSALLNGVNDLVIAVDSFGLCRQAFIMNDIRNPRGIISAKLSGLDAAAKKEAEDGWKIAGVDVQQLSNPYDTTGWPDERTKSTQWDDMKVIEELTAHPVSTFKVFAADGPRWIRFTFDYDHPADVHAPLRLHLDGAFTAIVLLNDIVVGRYYGNGDGPQHDFYLMDGLIKPQGNQVEMLVYTWNNVDDAQAFISGWPIIPGSGNLIKPFAKHLPDWKVKSDTFSI
ncbi:glycoside hydrolase superfamily [Umbelopsis sp. PMI_123]|nr:glycoside hydrolase superfamily [Umbelopsis sp. PMI_123]